MAKANRAWKKIGEKLVSVLSVLLTIVGMILFVIFFSAFLGGITGFSAPFAQQLHSASHQYPALSFLRYPEWWLPLVILLVTSINLTKSWIKENTHYKTVRNLILVSVFALSTIQFEFNIAAIITLITFIVISFINFLFKDCFKTKGWNKFHRPL